MKQWVNLYCERSTAESRITLEKSVQREKNAVNKYEFARKRNRVA